MKSKMMTDLKYSQKWGKVIEWWFDCNDCVAIMGLFHLYGVIIIPFIRNYKIEHEFVCL